MAGSTFARSPEEPHWSARSRLPRRTQSITRTAPRPLVASQAFSARCVNRNVKAAYQHWRPNIVLDTRSSRRSCNANERHYCGCLSPVKTPVGRRLLVALQSPRLQMYYRHGFEEDTWQCKTDFRVEILWPALRVWQLPRGSWLLTIRQICPSSPSA